MNEIAQSREQPEPREQPAPHEQREPRELHTQDVIIHKARSRVGAILNGKYRLDLLLGVGGTAAVYAATHRNGNRVAIKVLHGHLSFDGAVAGRLQQEGYVANLVDHPGALRIMDDDRTEDGAVYLIMELLDGEGLDARLKRKGWRLPPTEALGIAAAVLDVLAVAHHKGVVHRDIKPDNIFITRNGDIKVLDFGLARLVENPGPMGRTNSGVLFGTVGFMAPEQALGRLDEIDGRTDVWGMGATLFTMVTGRLVHEAPSINEQLVKAATRTAPPLASVMPGVDEGLAAVVDGALAFQRGNRWQTAHEMQEAVRTAAATMGYPEGAPLRGPRLSIEMDLDAVRRLGGAAGPWRTTMVPSFPPLGPAATTTVLSYPRPPRRFGAGLMVAVVAAGVGGWLMWRGGQRAQEGISAASAASTPARPPSLDPTAVLPMPAVPNEMPAEPVASAPAPAPAPTPPTAEPAQPPAVAASPPAKARPQKARAGRRAVRKPRSHPRDGAATTAVAAAPAAAAISVTAAAPTPATAPAAAPAAPAPATAAAAGPPSGTVLGTAPAGSATAPAPAAAAAAPAKAPATVAVAAPAKAPATAAPAKAPATAAVAAPAKPPAAAPAAAPPAISDEIWDRRQ
jgi:hypothetical protein